MSMATWRRFREAWRLCRTPVADIVNPPRPHRIGVWDYKSLIECLESNYSQAFPDLVPRDPQDMIQFMAATIMEQRRIRAASDTAGPGGAAAEYALMCATRGGDGIAPQVYVVAVSDSRDALERRKAERAKERVGWEGLPDWALPFVIGSEWITAVPVLR